MVCDCLCVGWLVGLLNERGVGYRVARMGCLFVDANDESCE